MKLPLLMFVLLTTARGSIWPHQATMDVPSSTGATIMSSPTQAPTQMANVLPKVIQEQRPTGISSLLKPPVALAETTIQEGIERTRENFLLARKPPKGSVTILGSMETMSFAGSNKIHGSINNDGFLTLSSSAPQFISQRKPTHLPLNFLENAEDNAMVSNVASEVASNKIYVCGSLPNEIVVTRPGGGSIVIEGASRISVLDDTQNSVIICPPSTNLNPPLSLEDSARVYGISTELKPPEYSELQEVTSIAEPEMPILKSYLAPPYTQW